MDLLDIQLVIDRLTSSAAGPGGALRAVVSAADLEAMRSRGSVIASPTAAPLFMGAQWAIPKEGSGPLRQTGQMQVSVVIAVKLAGALGAAGLKQLAAPCAAVRAALFGWEHPQAERQFWMGDEGVEEFDQTTGLLFYRMDFHTFRRLTEEF